MQCIQCILHYGAIHVACRCIAWLELQHMIAYRAQDVLVAGLSLQSTHDPGCHERRSQSMKEMKLTAINIFVDGVQGCGALP